MWNDNSNYGRDGRVKDDTRVRRGHHDSQHRLVPSTATPNDSFVPPPMAMTTAYGVNGPQWTAAGGPPPLVYHLSPYGTVPLPPLAVPPAQIHPLLASPRAGGAMQTAISWDLAMPPTTAVCMPMHGTRERYHWQDLPATGDNAHAHPSITVYVPQFPSPIVVFPTRSFVSVGDVLATVYRALRAFAHAALKADGRRAHAQVHPPAWGAPRPPQDEIALAVRTYLAGRTQWAGLVPCSTEPDAWVLRTSDTALR